MTQVMEKEKTVPGLKGEFIGQMISSDLKEIFRKYISSNDKGFICQKTGVGYHTTDKLLSGVNPLTHNNCKALVAAVELAIEITTAEIEEAKEAKKKMTSILIKGKK